MRRRPRRALWSTSTNEIYAHGKIKMSRTARLGIHDVIASLVRFPNLRVDLTRKALELSYFLVLDPVPCPRVPTHPLRRR